MFQIINLENKTSPGVISPYEFKLITHALSLQIIKDYNTSPWVEHGYCNPAEVRNLTGPLPAGAWNLIFIDDTSVEGALGFHEDIEGTKIPVSYVAVKESRESDTLISEVASHECLEMLVDPEIEEPKIVKHENREYIVEICDPVQNIGYPIGNAGVIVSDFCWPAWFGMNQTRTRITQRESVTIPFTLSLEGYISIKEPNQEWTQIFGDKINKLPNWASRLPRIHGNIK